MSKFTAEHTVFYVVREREIEGNHREQLLQINSWDGSTYWTDLVSNATEFETVEKAKEAAQLQELLMKFAGITCDLKILQKDEIIQFVSDKE